MIFATSRYGVYQLQNKSQRQFALTHLVRLIAATDVSRSDLHLRESKSLKSELGFFFYLVAWQVRLLLFWYCQEKLILGHSSWVKGLKFVLHVTWTQCCEDWNRTVKGGNMNTGGEIFFFFWAWFIWCFFFFSINSKSFTFTLWLLDYSITFCNKYWKSKLVCLTPHLSIEQIKLRLTAYLSMFTSSWF